MTKINPNDGGRGRFQEFAESGRFLWEYLRGSKSGPVWFSAMLVVSAIAALTEVTSVLFVAPIIDLMSERELYDNIPFMGDFVALFRGFDVGVRLKLIALFMVFFVAFRGIALFAASVLGSNFVAKIQEEITLPYYRDTLFLRMSFIDHKSYGYLSNLVVAQIGRVAEIVRNINQIIFNLSLIPFYGALMLAISIPATIGALVFSLTSLLFLRVVGKWQIRLSRRWTQAAIDFSQHSADTLTSIKVLRLATAESYAVKKFETLMKRTFKLQRIFNSVNNINGPLITTLGGVLIAALLLGGSFLFDGASVDWLGQILVFLLIMTRLIGPTAGVNQAGLGILQHVSALRDLMEYKQACLQERETWGDICFEGLKTGLSFDDVSFTYSGSGQNAGRKTEVLKNLSFTVRPGEMVAIVGPSGAGKSTIANLIARLYDPSEGRVLVDGSDLKCLDLPSWRRHLGFVTQDILIFNISIAENIRFGSAEASLDDVIAAAKLAQADGFIRRMASGYDSLAGQNGGFLSGGERQRLVIARVLLQRPDILILDEATSNLDSLTEYAFQQSMSTLRGSCTMVVIAHRLATVVNADRILVIDEGRLVESGSHRELLENGGRYAEMVRRQSFDEVVASK